MDLQGKRILITGAARGLGRELAALFEKEGCALLLVDREPAPQSNAQAYL
ncbi:MAG: SDR family NAD(P)-dependent oxidoreductase, partial [Chloroflexi bacterium]|nr:SDR family NAD(P)-dependent oxidoreductase [Chloroflexota bacterium]